MKKFKFKLQAVHNVRELRQERESLILEELHSEANLAAARVAQIEKTRNEAIETYTRQMKSGEPLNPMEMELNSDHFVRLNRLRQEEERVVEQKKQACVRQAETVVAAMREVKITGRLRENQSARHQLEFEREQQSNIDELVTTTFARKIAQAK
jgi:flagellar export protein FliJ